MRKLAVLLVLIICLCLAACSNPSDSATTDQSVAPDNTVSTAPAIQFPSTDPQSAINVLSSAQAQLDAAASQFEAITGSNRRGWRLDRATEYYVFTPQNYPVHGLLFQITGDVAYGDRIYCDFQIGVDLTSGEAIFSGTDDFDAFMNGFSGDFTCGRDVLMCCISSFPVYEEGGQFYFPNEQTYHFSQDMIDQINTTLGWIYTPHPHDVPTEDITSTAEDRVSMVTDAIQQFLSQRGNEMLENYATTFGGEKSAVTVSHAMEYRLGSMDGYPVHALLINLHGNFAAETSSNDQLQIFYDLQTGEVYDSFMLTNEFFEGFEGICRNEADVPLVLLNMYNNVVNYGAPYVVRDGEKSITLTEDELAQIAAAITE